MITFTDLGQTDFLTAMVGKENLICRLFTNDIIPKYNYQQDKYIEVLPLVYRYCLITPDQWKVKIIKDYVEPEKEDLLGISAIANFQFSGYSDKVYGYYVEGETSGILKFASRFDTPYSIGVEGGSIVVSINLVLKNV